MNFNALKSFCFAFTPRPYKLCSPHVHINNVPLVYVDSIKYLGFTFSINHKDDDDMLRQMRTLYARSNRIIRIFHNCVASLQKGPHVAKIKNDIFVDLHRAGHDKSVRKKISLLAQICTKLWSIYELHNYIILIIILKINI